MLNSRLLLPVLLFAIPVMLFASSAAVDWLGSYSWHDQQRIFQLLLLCATAVLVWFYPPQALKKPVFIALLVIFLLGFFSALLSQWPEWAFREWARYVGLVLLALLVARLAADKHGLWFFLSVLVVAGAVSAYQFLLFYAMAFITGIQMLHIDILFHGFSNPRFLGQFQILLMPIMAGLILHHWQNNSRYSCPLVVIIFILLSVHWCLAFSLGGRGVFLGLLVAHVVLIIAVPRLWRLIFVQILTAFTGLLLFYLMFYWIPSGMDTEPVLRDGLRSGLSSRNIIWAIAWNTAVENPLLGIGPMHLAASINTVASHPHQVILQWLAEWGWPATLVALTLGLWGIFHMLFFIRRGNGNSLNAALWISIVAALVLAQFDGVFVMPYSETWLAIIIGLALSVCTSEQITSLQTNIWKLLSVPLFIILIQVLLIEAPRLPQDTEAFLEQHNQTGRKPRFWVQGWIPMYGNN